MCYRWGHWFCRAAAALWLALAGTGAVLAQDATAAAKAASPDAANSTAPEDTVRQIHLTEAQIKGFIAAQADLAGYSEKLQEAGHDLDPALQKKLDALAKKHGFADFSELDDVAANISIVMAGLDSQTGVFTDPVDALKKELADVEADNAIPADDKKQLVDELNLAIKTTPPLEHKENVDLVKAHREEIEKALE